MTKRCFRCGLDKEKCDFYAHPLTNDGVLGKCKQCTRGDVARNRKNKIDYYRAYDKDRGRRETPGYAKNYRRSNPLMAKAHGAVSRAVRDGILLKKSCSVCGDKKAIAHHENYRYPLNVTWLCQAHHRTRHSEIKKERIELHMKI